MFNQIDHLLILVDRSWASSIMNIRSFRGASCGSDHFLVKSIFRCVMRFRAGGKSMTFKFGIGKLKDKAVK
jgi:hypothetical protein